ncbi:MAG: hypothetical protein JKY28_04475 [Sulfurimonas sp.]|nr:hypothetical protein [Sulfurimonas sp.]
MYSMIITFVILTGTLFSQATFQSNTTCKECHPTIYKEHEGAMHNRASIFKDPIHKAVWDKHPLKKKKKYKCAKCHTPAAKTIQSMPDMNDPTHLQAISCAYCHRIESIELGSKSNKNIINKKEKNYFATIQNPVENTFHTAATNTNFKTAQVCMGCHSHKKNKEKLDVCSTTMGKLSDKNNCISCHMPKVSGSVSTFRDTLKHSYHGFPGANAGQEMLAKYIDIRFIQKSDGFSVSIYNQSPHAMLLHPLRVLQLRVSVERNERVEEFKPKVFMRVLGKNKKPTPPWLATQLLKNTMIKAKETRVLSYTKELEPDDKIKVTLGYYLVNPKLVVKFTLQTNEKAKKFNILKEVIFKVK